MKELGKNQITESGHWIFCRKALGTYKYACTFGRRLYLLLERVAQEADVPCCSSRWLLEMSVNRLMNS